MLSPIKHIIFSYVYKIRVNLWAAALSRKVTHFQWYLVFPTLIKVSHNSVMSNSETYWWAGQYDDLSPLLCDNCVNKNMIDRQQLEHFLNGFHVDPKNIGSY